tara:strand:+ start:193 stop:582 length:390 start_codon:yes stop_codon:yes gene_type:complete
MKKLHHTKYKKNYKKYILSCIENDINDEPIKTDEQKIKYIFDRFYSEYGFMINRIGKQKAIAEWLSGLALNIAFYYDDIIDLAIEMGSINTNPSDNLRNQVQQNYWYFMANIIIELEYDIKKSKEEKKA